MNKTKRLFTGGWLGNALSIFTRGWFTGTRSNGLVFTSFVVSRPRVRFVSKQPEIEFEIV